MWRGREKKESDRKPGELGWTTYVQSAGSNAKYYVSSVSIFFYYYFRRILFIEGIYR